MIKTQSQNNEIRQIARVGYEVRDKAGNEVWYQVLWNVGLKVRCEVRCEVWEKGLLQGREKAIL
jgi:hypothetical protein